MCNLECTVHKNLSCLHKIICLNRCSPTALPANTPWPCPQDNLPITEFTKEKTAICEDCQTRAFNEIRIKNDLKPIEGVIGICLSKQDIDLKTVSDEFVEAAKEKLWKKRELRRLEVEEQRRVRMAVGDINEANEWMSGSSEDEDEEMLDDDVGEGNSRDFGEMMDDDGAVLMDDDLEIQQVIEEQSAMAKAEREAEEKREERRAFREKYSLNHGAKIKRKWKGKSKEIVEENGESGSSGAMHTQSIGQHINKGMSDNPAPTTPRPRASTLPPFEPSLAPPPTPRLRALTLSPPELEQTEHEMEIEERQMVEDVDEFQQEMDQLERFERMTGRRRINSLVERSASMVLADQQASMATSTASGDKGVSLDVDRDDLTWKGKEKVIKNTSEANNPWWLSAETDSDGSGHTEKSGYESGYGSSNSGDDSRPNIGEYSHFRPSSFAGSNEGSSAAGPSTEDGPSTRSTRRHRLDFAGSSSAGESSLRSRFARESNAEPSNAATGSTDTRPNTSDPTNAEATKLQQVQIVDGNNGESSRVGSGNAATTPTTGTPVISANVETIIPRPRRASRPNSVAFLLDHLQDKHETEAGPPIQNRDQDNAPARAESAYRRGVEERIRWHERKKLQSEQRETIRMQSQDFAERRTREEAGSGCAMLNDGSSRFPMYGSAPASVRQQVRQQESQAQRTREQDIARSGGAKDVATSGRGSGSAERTQRSPRMRPLTPINNLDINEQIQNLQKQAQDQSRDLDESETPMDSPAKGTNQEKELIYEATTPSRFQRQYKTLQQTRQHMQTLIKSQRIQAGSATYTGAGSDNLSLNAAPLPIYNALAVAPQISALVPNPLNSTSTISPPEIQSQRTRRRREHSVRKEKNRIMTQRRKGRMSEIRVRRRDEENVARGRTVLGPSLREVENSFLDGRISSISMGPPPRPGSRSRSGSRAGSLGVLEGGEDQNAKEHEDENGEEKEKEAGNS